MTSGVFITGTDTDAGKTIITAGLLRALLKQGINAAAVKPVQTGYNTTLPDASVYAMALPEKNRQDGERAQTWSRYRRPCSPHLAAEEEQRPVDLSSLEARYAACRVEGLYMLVEGAGGVHTPLSRRETMVDLMERLQLPVVLVAANRLGAISQTLMALEALRNRDLEVLGVVLNRSQPPSAGTDDFMLADHAQTIADLGHVRILADIPWLGELASADAAWDILAAHLSAAASLLIKQRTCVTPSTASPESLLAFDRAHLWHPYTSATHPLPCREAVSACGSRIRLRDGRELVDGMASWWCAIHGYGHPHIVSAVQSQLRRMPHIMFGGLTHAPAVRLTEQLLPMLPAGLEHVFLADSGSVAVEVALKMAVQYWQAKGKPEKARFITPRGGYHGDTLGAMCVCDPVNGMHSLFSGLLPQQIFVERPSCRFDAPFDPTSLCDLEQAVREHASQCAALILEPIVQGAGGMWMYHPEYLRQARALCTTHDLLLICDEIATGFGRTGELFATNWAHVNPDILCLGKALTGGVMTLAATCATRDVAHGISEHGGVFMHGPTFMGNPLACSAATASLELLQTNAWSEQVAALQAGLSKGLEPCRDLPDVRDVRVLGGIGVVELSQPVNVAAAQEFFVQAGVWIRPFGKLLYLMPPYISSKSDVERLTSAIFRAVREGACR